MRSINLLITFSLLFTFVSCKDEITEEQSDVNGVILPVKPGDRDDSEMDNPNYERATVLSVKSLNVDGDYNAGKKLKFSIQFSSDIEVEGEPLLDLQLDGHVSQAKYLYLKDNDTLIFEYEVEMGDKVTRLAYQDRSSLKVLDGKIKDSRDVEVDYALPEPGTTNSLSGRYNINFSNSDNFESQEISPQWSFLDMDNWDADGNGMDNDDIHFSFKTFSGKLFLSSRGRNIWKSRNEFVTVYLNNQIGDYEYSIKIDSENYTSKWSKTGILVANNMEDFDDAGLYNCVVTGKKGIEVQYSKNSEHKFNKSITSGTSEFPVWIKVKKWNNQFYCSYKYSEDAPWIQHKANPIEVSSAGQISDVGIVTTSHSCSKTKSTQIESFKQH